MSTTVASQIHLINASLRRAGNGTLGRLWHLQSKRAVPIMTVTKAATEESLVYLYSYSTRRTMHTFGGTGISCRHHSSSVPIDGNADDNVNENTNDNTNTNGMEGEDGRKVLSASASESASESVSVSVSVSVSSESFLVNNYKKMASESQVALDIHQIAALTELDRLRNDILSSSIYNGNTNETTCTTSNSIGDGEEDEKYSHSYSYSSSFFPFMKNNFPNFFDSRKGSLSLLQALHRAPKGVYLHGGVGCGKTFCMDLFHNHLPVASNMKQKVHFHKFMLDVHRRMHEAKMVERVEGDPLPAVIDDFIRDGLIICFDEFQVTDVADALILRRLFTGLLEKGAVIVATSNRPPKDLYLNGIQRDLFLPFIDALEEKNNVVSMWESDVDYRLVQGENKARGVYFVGKDNDNDAGAGAAAKSDFNCQFEKLTKGSMITSTKLVTQGRSVDIPSASLEYKVARVSFDDMCRKPLGAADYLVIGDNFHTVFIEDVPMLTMNDVNLVRRFIVFVDSMYECHVKLIVHAEAMPEDIFVVDLDNEHCDEAFAFDRTRSRLEEMGSDEYLKRRWVGSAATTNSSSSSSSSSR